MNKKKIKLIILLLLKFLDKFYFFKKLFLLIIHKKNNDFKTIVKDNFKISFYIPNQLCEFRVNTFYTKEPETLDWIDSFKDNSIFWDVGANIGLYSCYAALKKKIKIIAFEPSVFNLEILAKNIFINNCVEKINIVSLPLGENNNFNKFRMSNTSQGGALSSFDKNIDWKGDKIDSIFEYKILGSSVDDLVNNFKLEYPDYIKIDIDGLEHIILKNANNVLKNAKEILIEVNDNFKDQATNVKKILDDSGFKMTKKLHSEYIDKNDEGFEKTYNQIWIKENDK